MKIKSYCINLKRAVKRKSKFESDWREILGNELEYFEAIDGRFLEHTSFLTARGLACLRSHLRCMELALKTEYEYFLFFQDDAIPIYENIFEILQAAQSETNSDILFCCLRRKYIDYVLEKYVPNISIGSLSIIKGVPDEICEGACMVFYTREGIKQYLNTFSTEEYHADWYRVLKNAKMYTLVPPLCDHIDEDSYISNHYGRKFIS